VAVPLVLTPENTGVLLSPSPAHNWLQQLWSHGQEHRDVTWSSQFASDINNAGQLAEDPGEVRGGRGCSHGNREAKSEMTSSRLQSWGPSIQGTLKNQP
jgi:hypothetical protein